MRIIVHGQQAFGRAVLEALLERGEQVIAVYCAPDKGSRIDPLKELAQEKNLPLYQPESFKNSEVWEQMRSLDADLCVMAYVTLFVPEEALNMPRYGTIQYHPSLLPDHKGPSSINWPIIFGKKKTGLSIFWPDNGLDTGPILLQKEVEVGDNDTLGSVYFDRLFPMGVEAMLEGVDLVREGKAPKIPQDPDAGSYEGWCRKENVQIDWSKPVNEVHNLIRGADPQPGAWTTCKGETVQLYDSRKVPGGGGGSPGSVTGLSGDTMRVAAAGGDIEVARVRPEGGKKMGAGEFARASALQVGDTLGS